VAPARNRNWVWFFVAVGVLAVVAIAVLIYGMRFRRPPLLTKERLEAARKLWEEKGPKDYELTYEVRRAGSDKTDVYVVRVRQGKTDSVRVNGVELGAEKFSSYGMPAMFNDLWQFLRLNDEPGQPKATVWATFDEEDGHIRSYSRRVLERQYEVEVMVVEVTVTELKPLP
jgi:hypothetical protein